MIVDQRAAIAVDFKPFFKKESMQRKKAGVYLPDKCPEGRTNNMAGKIVGVSGKSVYRAEHLKEEDPVTAYLDRVKRF